MIRKSALIAEISDTKPIMQAKQPFFLIKERASLAHIVAKEKARRWFIEFIYHYLSAHFDCAMGEHHQDLIDSVQSPKTDKRIVRCEPRDSGKSTFLLFAAPLWWLARQDKWYICLFGGSGGAFWNHYSTLQNTLDRSIGNQALLDDYPHLSPMMDFKGQFVSWNDSRIKVTSGAIVEARTMGSHVRGLKEGKWRPDAMVFDDPQDTDTVATDYQRAKFLNRFRTTLVNLIASPGDIFVIGNFLNPESMVGTLMRQKSWDGKLYRAENIPQDEHDEQWPIGNKKTDGSALWPERWPLEKLHQRREEIGARAYSLEYMNKQASDEELVYDSVKFQKFDAQEFIAEMDDSYRVIAYWDPSDPKQSNFQAADYACIAVVACKSITLQGRELMGKNKDGKDYVIAKESLTHNFYWVLHVWLNQARVELQCEEALRLVQAYPIKTLYYEDNGGFGVLLPYLKKIAKERNITVPLRTFTQTANKIQRIYNLEPVIKTRTFFASHLSTTYYNQWDNFPFDSHDDGPDATCGAILAFERSKKAFAF